MKVEKVLLLSSKILRFIGKLLLIITALFILLILLTGLVVGYIDEKVTGMVEGFLGALIVSVGPLTVGGGISLLLTLLGKFLEFLGTKKNNWTGRGYNYPVPVLDANTVDFTSSGPEQTQRMGRG